MKFVSKLSYYLDNVVLDEKRNDALGTQVSIYVCMHLCVYFLSLSSSLFIPGRLDEAKDVAIEPVVGRTADSQRLARLEPALWTE